MKDEQERWVKLHLKLLDNELFYKDHTGLVLFLWCLLRAYPKGTVTTGRFQIARSLGLNPNTTYSAIKRLEKGGFINTTSNNRFTDISICNWSKYQTLGNTPVNNTATTEQQLSNNTATLLENKSIEKELDTNTPLTPQGVIPLSKESREDWEYWEEHMVPITRNQIFHRNTLVRLRKIHGKERLHKMIRLASVAHQEKFVPQTVKCSSPTDLEKKWDALMLWGKAKFTQQQTETSTRIKFT